MANQTPLRGSCSCGRNEYLIFTPLNGGAMQVIGDDNAHRGLSLRIPLVEIQSTTYAFYPDETHSSIRRVFIPPKSPETKRHFCGFCGTHLTSWSEIDEEEADWICVSLAILKNESLERLDDAGLLFIHHDIEVPRGNTVLKDRMTRNQEVEVKGAPWFEDMIKGSQLGRIRRRRGEDTSSDRKSRIEWEIMEVEDDDGSSFQGIGKRKYAEEVHMEE